MMEHIVCMECSYIIQKRLMGEIRSAWKEKTKSLQVKRFKFANLQLLILENAFLRP